MFVDGELVVDPRHGDIAFYEDCVPGGDPYRVVVVWRHRDPAQGWFNVAGVLTRPIDVAGKKLFLVLRNGHPPATANIRVHERPVPAHT